MRTRKILISFALATCLVFLPTGCQKANNTTEDVQNSDIEEDTTITPPDSVETIGISMPAQHLERWVHDGALLEESFKALGYDVEIAYGDNLIDTQINDINQMIDNDVDLLIIAPVDSDSLSSCMERANEKNIPVLAYDRLILHAPNLLAYVSYDNYEVGMLQAEFIIDSLNLETDKTMNYNIEIFAGDPADNNALFFYQGAMDALSPFLESGVLTVPSKQSDFYSCSTSSWSTELAEERMQIILSSYYNSQKLHAVLSPNDSIALGVLYAVDDSYKRGNPIVITGQDCDSANIDYIRSGKQSMSIYKDLNDEVEATTYIVQSYLDGISIDSDLTTGNDFDFEIKRDTSSYSSDDVPITSYLLEPIVVTKDNLDEIIEE